MSMRITLAATVALTLAFGGAALAQTGQGGYLGSNPGADAGPPKPPSEEDMMIKPAAFCMRMALDPGRCMGRGAFEHDYCREKSADRVQYTSCRRAMDFIGYRP